MNTITVLIDEDTKVPNQKGTRYLVTSKRDDDTTQEQLLKGK